ncbi:MAG: hypothetical protein NC311_04075 [Muribaculaceae bacterium]|nr:hypothetical protein [Muribaculaceae bacterium]
MNNDKSILEETLHQIRDMYSPANDRMSKIQLNIAVSMLKGMISVQQASEKLGSKMKQHLQNHIKSKVR